MLLRTVLMMITAFCLIREVGAQLPASFPTDYFRNPLDVPIYLSGGYGEIRPNHFHTGMDIKTQGKENLPVHAAADGYIARISISGTGYGNCLYINHPNGYTTVYAHLNDFYPELQQWMIEQQYQRESWAIQLFPKPYQFSVKKGQVIAWSGTTGGSMGPHLHFEVRDTKTEQVLNSLRFGLPYTDGLPPTAESLALYDGRISIYRQSPQTIALRRIASGRYQTVQQTITSTSPVIFLGIQAKDYMEGSQNWMGIYRMRLFMDEKLQASTLFDALDFSQSRYANAYADYKTRQGKGIWYQGLYRLPNNRLDVYPEMNNREGRLDIADGQLHRILVELYDPKGNKSELRFSVRYDREKDRGMAAVNRCDAGVYWDCRQANAFEDTLFSFSAPKGAFYDDVCFTYSVASRTEALSASVQVMGTEIPLQQPCQVALKLYDAVPDKLRSKIAFVHHVKPTRLPGNNPQTGMVADYIDGWAQASVRTLGNYYCVIDTIPPKIIAYQPSGQAFSKGQSIRFKATDDITSVVAFKGYLDGRWLRFVRKGDTYTYQMDEYCPAGSHVLELHALDENNNEQVYRYSFVRQ